MEKSLEDDLVIPDEVILPTREDLASGRDPVMTRAAKLSGMAQLIPERAGQPFSISLEAVEGARRDVRTGVVQRWSPFSLKCGESELCSCRLKTDSGGRDPCPHEVPALAPPETHREPIYLYVYSSE
jgi:hypothetical protein